MHVVEYATTFCQKIAIAAFIYTAGDDDYAPHIDEEVDVPLPSDDLNENEMAPSCAARQLCSGSVLASLKKALSLVPQLSPKLIMIDTTCRVVGYASREIEQLFLQAIDKGMLESFSYTSKLAFLCFGPVSKFYSPILSTGGSMNLSLEERNKGSCTSIHKIQEEKAMSERVTRIG